MVGFHSPDRNAPAATVFSFDSCESRLPYGPLMRARAEGRRERRRSARRSQKRGQERREAPRAGDRKLHKQDSLASAPTRLPWTTAAPPLVSPKVISETMVFSSRTIPHDRQYDWPWVESTSTTVELHCGHFPCKREAEASTKAGRESRERGLERTIVLMDAAEDRRRGREKRMGEGWVVWVAVERRD